MLEKLMTELKEKDAANNKGNIVDKLQALLDYMKACEEIPGDAKITFEKPGKETVVLDNVNEFAILALQNGRLREVYYCTGVFLQVVKTQIDETLKKGGTSHEKYKRRYQGFTG